MYDTLHMLCRDRNAYLSEGDYTEYRMINSRISGYIDGFRDIDKSVSFVFKYDEKDNIESITIYFNHEFTFLNVD